MQLRRDRRPRAQREFTGPVSSAHEWPELRFLDDFLTKEERTGIEWHCKYHYACVELVKLLLYLTHALFQVILVAELPLRVADAAKGCMCVRAPST